MKTNINKGQMDTNTQLLAEYINTVPMIAKSTTAINKK